MCDTFLQQVVEVAGVAALGLRSRPAIAFVGINPGYNQHILRRCLLLQCHHLSRSTYCSKSVCSGHVGSTSYAVQRKRPAPPDLDTETSREAASSALWPSAYLRERASRFTRGYTTTRENDTALLKRYE